MFSLSFRNKKNKLLNETSEMKMKKVDEKIKVLKYELYKNISTLQTLKHVGIIIFLSDY